MRSKRTRSTLCSFCLFVKSMFRRMASLFQELSEAPVTSRSPASTWLSASSAHFVHMIWSTANADCAA